MRKAVIALVLVLFPLCCGTALAGAQRTNLITPRSSPAYPLLVQMLDCHDRSDYEQAVSLANRALKADPGNADAYAELSICRIHEKNYAQSVRDADKSLLKDRNNLLALQSRAFSFLCLGRYKDGISDYTRVLKIDPSNTQAYFNRARAYQKLGLQALAAADMAMVKKLGYSDESRDINKSPDDLLCQGRADAALASLNRAIHNQSNSARLYRWRADVYMALNDYDLAIADYTQALKLAAHEMSPAARPSQGPGSEIYSEDFAANMAVDVPSEPIGGHCYLKRALAYVELGKTSEAIADCTEGLNDPAIKPYHLLLVRAQALERQGKPELALLDYCRILALEPDDALVRVWRAKTYLRLGKRDLAVADCRRAISEDAALQEAYLTLLPILSAENRLKDAIQLCTEAIERFRGDSRFMLLRATAYAGNKQYDLAIKDYASAQDLDELKPDALNARADCYEKMGDAEHARQDRASARLMAAHPCLRRALPPLPVKEHGG